MASLGMDSGLWVDEGYSVQYPSPYLFISRLSQLGLEYHPSIIEKPALDGISEQTSRCALQLGVATVRYAYATYHDDQLQADVLLRTIFECVDRLGLGDILEEAYTKRVMDAWDRGTDVLPQMMGLLMRSAQTLHREGRGHAYALIAAASWLESTRLLIALTEYTDHQALRTLISEQRYTLPVVLEHLAGFVYEDSVTLGLYPRLERISEPMRSIPISYQYERTEIDTQATLCRIESTMIVSMTAAHLKALRRETSDLVTWTTSQ